MDNVRTGHFWPGHPERGIATYRAAIQVLEGLGTALSSRVASLLLEGRFWEVVNLSITPSEYDDAELFRRDYLAVELMSKYPHFPIDLDRDRVAYDKFNEAEAACRITNSRLSTYGSEWGASSSVSLASVFHTARGKIQRLLGEFSMRKVEPYFDFGPGASTRLPRSKSGLHNKVSGPPECTVECEPLARMFILHNEGWANAIRAEGGDFLRVVPGCRITTVPKNAKTNRVIAIEPDLNMFFQKGFGGYIRKRLAFVGVDLNDQTLNQGLASVGSQFGLSTIDLSNASDSVSIALVRELLPPDWFEWMDSVRSKRGLLEGKLITFDKFSSMGNGFTFELESLLFWALAKSTVELLTPTLIGLPVSVYGDDIIVPSGAYVSVVSTLNFAGFTVNKKKSFSDGPFRESCGSHYFNGEEVTPFYIRDYVESDNRRTWLCNSISRWSSRGWYRDSLLHPVFEEIRASIHRNFRTPVPLELQDFGIVTSLDVALPKRARNWLDGWLVTTLQPSTRSVTPTVGNPSLASLYRLSKSGSFHVSKISYLRLRTLRRVVPQGLSYREIREVKPSRGSRWRWVKTLTPTWSCYGPWL